MIGVDMVDASVVVITYNHAKFVALCFRSILEQATSRRIQIIWHDDASTDETVALGEEALRDCPHEVIRIHRTNNRKSRGIPFLLDLVESCLGKYVFLLEGDDCWLLQNKIDLQIDALDSRPNLQLCFTPALIFSGGDVEPMGVLARHGPMRKECTLDEVILGDGAFMPTASLCFRRHFFATAPLWLFGRNPCSDYPMQVLASSPAGALYLPEITCGYRTNLEESWTTKTFNHPQKRMIFQTEFLAMLVRLHETLPGHTAAFAQMAYSHFADLFDQSIKNNDFSSLETALHSLKQIR